MPIESTSDVFRKSSDAWQDCMDKDDFHAAIEIGIDAYHILRKNNDQQLARGALNLIHVAIDAISESDNLSAIKPACSFCGRDRSKVRLGAGSEAFICAECVATLNQILNRDEQ